MHPILVEVFGLQIASYGLFMILGAVAAWFLIRLLAGADGKENGDISLVFLICVCGALAGAFTLRPLMKIPEVIIHWEHFRQMPVDVFFSYMFGEIVFYGGLIGGIVAMLLFCGRYKIPAVPIADLFAPALAAAHSVGRIGCFLGGCCYGIPVRAAHPFAVTFPPASMGAPAGTPILATQLIEAAGLLMIAAILVLVYKKTASRINGLTVSLYAALYSVLRFVLEFYRGDLARGIYGPFSTSQYISLALFIVSAALIFMIAKKRKHPL